MVLLAAYCGLRFGELAALTRRHLDPMHETVTVAASASQIPGQGRHVGPPKSEASRRTVAIPPHLLTDIEDHLARYAELGHDGLVFVGTKGGPLNSANFGAKLWRPARQAVGLPEVHFHDLRHHAAQFVAVMGATEAEIMHRLGHSTADMARRYQRATAERDVDLARLMSQTVEKARVTALPRAVPS